MSGFERILVTTDFSEAANRALPVAIGMAKVFDAELHILHVAVPNGDTEIPNVRSVAGAPPPSSLEEALESLAAAADTEGAAPRRVVAVRRGFSAYDGILGYAQERGIGLVVISTHGRSGLSYVFMGSIAERVLRHTTCPVLVVQARRDTVASGALPQGPILVPCDLSEASQRAGAYAARLAVLAGQPVHLLHVVEASRAAVYTTLGLRDPATEDPERVAQHAREMMEAMFAPLFPPEVTVRPIIRRGANPSKEILRYAEESGAGMITMTFQGYDEIGDFLVGSTTERTIRRSPCPVLVV